jgi:hypothetical protein
MRGKGQVHRQLGVTILPDCPAALHILGVRWRAGRWHLPDYRAGLHTQADLAVDLQAQAIRWPGPKGGYSQSDDLDLLFVWNQRELAER